MSEIDERMAQEARKTAEGLSDEELARIAKAEDLSSIEYEKVQKDGLAYKCKMNAAILRDYVRLRKEIGAVKAKVAECDECDDYNRTEFCREAIDDIKRIFDGTSDGADKPKVAEDAELKNKVYGKYVVTDAKTGERKDGKYFILKIDAKEDLERSAVREAMKTYIAEQLKCGKGIYASQVALYAGIQKSEVESEWREEGQESADTASAPTAAANGGVSREDREKLVTLYDWAKETKKKVESLGMFRAAGPMGLFLNTALSTLGEVLPNFKPTEGEDHA